MPGRIRLADLPPELRRKLAGRAARPAPARTRPAIDDEIPPRWRCYGCGATFTAWAAAQRHANIPDHHRIQLDLEGDM